MFSQRLKSLRAATGMNQKELASALHLDYKRYNHYETGRSEPDNSTLTLIADYFNVTVDYLLGRSAPETKKEAAVPKDDGLTPLERELIQLLHQLTPDQKRLLLAQIKTLLAEQGSSSDSLP